VRESQYARAVKLIPCSHTSYCCEPRNHSNAERGMLAVCWFSANCRLFKAPVPAITAVVPAQTPAHASSTQQTLDGHTFVPARPRRPAHSARSDGKSRCAPKKFVV